MTMMSTVTAIVHQPARSEWCNATISGGGAIDDDTDNVVVVRADSSGADPQNNTHAKKTQKASIIEVDLVKKKKLHTNLASASARPCTCSGASTSVATQSTTRRDHSSHGTIACTPRASSPVRGDESP